MLDTGDVIDMIVMVPAVRALRIQWRITYKEGEVSKQRDKGQNKGVQAEGTVRGGRQVPVKGQQEGGVRCLM